MIQKMSESEIGPFWKAKCRRVLDTYRTNLGFCTKKIPWNITYRTETDLQNSEKLSKLYINLLWLWFFM
jgi:hypothetical protein